MTRSFAFAVPALAAAALGLSACGDGGGGASATNANDDADAARIRFEQCLRRNGVDLPDGPGRPRNIDAEKMQRAMKACERYREAASGNLTDEQRQEFRDAFARFASCMRREGIDVPDPPARGSNGGGGAVRRLTAPTPREQKAMQTCRKELPNGGGRGPGGGIVIGPGPAR